MKALTKARAKTERSLREICLQPGQGTEKHYAKLLARLVRRFAEEYERAWYEDWSLFYSFLVQWAEGLAPASWMSYRCALRHYQRFDAPQWFVDALYEIKAQGSSRGVIKKLPDADLERLTKAVEASPRSQFWVRYAMIWLVIGRATGLRPREWWGAYQCGPDWLCCPNAKYRERLSERSTERAFGPYRHLYIGELSTDVRGKITAFLDDVVREYDADKAEKQAAQALNRLQKREWPRRTMTYCLYSARHQFAADAKAAGFSPIEIAAMMGHASAETAMIHYGKKRSGRSGGCLVVPHVDDVAAVARLNPAYCPGAQPDSSGVKGPATA
ncbi:hypothetical protein QWY84_06340 [Aquisalimonas lutea]|uniref:hypothetical protein n=1 Tax=Aquisalimonas lutea TaxID=1327750 RepID=UPI0025B2BACE|nr:hypothetical protein [Aquisalimonas lutea]MDN3517219.1 hypothetical protein [Aquisalimonas lutea]